MRDQETIAYSCDLSQGIFKSACLFSRAALSNSHPNACVPSREAVCTNFMMVFAMIWPGREPTTYRMRGDTLTTKSSRPTIITYCVMDRLIYRWAWTCVPTDAKVRLFVVKRYSIGDNTTVLLFRTKRLQSVSRASWHLSPDIIMLIENIWHRCVEKRCAHFTFIWYLSNQI